MSRRLIDYDPLTGVSQFFHPSDDGNSFTVETVQDVSPFIDENKAIRNEDTGRYRDGMHKVASIPNVVFHELIKKGIVGSNGQPTDKKRFKAWLNDPDNRYFRTKEGTV